MTISTTSSIAPLNQVLQRIRVVLVETSHPGNVGAVARAVKNMGLQQVVLVQPRFADVCHQAEAIALASGAGDVLAGMQIAPDLTAALQGCDYAIALSARGRDLNPAQATPRATAQAMLQHLNAHVESQIALVFGSERYGLSNAQVLQCQRYCMIPANPEYPSLNLAQAVQLLTYECRLAALAACSESTSHPAASAYTTTTRYATVEQMEQLYTHLQQALEALGFLHPQQPKKLMQRLRRLLARAQPEQEEWQLLRGICSAMLRTAQQADVQPSSSAKNPICNNPDS